MLQPQGELHQGYVQSTSHPHLDHPFLPTFHPHLTDLSQLGRPVDETIIIDNSPVCYSFHPSNAVPISTWFNDPHDSELSDLLGFLADLSTVEDVRGVLDGGL